MSDADITHVGQKPGQTQAQTTTQELKSSLDGSMQPLRYWKASGAGRPVLVFLHSWSADLNMNPGDWFPQAVQRDWHFVMPNFRGPNNNFQACGSRLARQDVLDSVDFALTTLQADPQRVYLAGGSGGGHMTMVMAGYHPDRFTAASAHCGISNLFDWYRHHCKAGVEQNYARMISQSVGGAPGSSQDVDHELYERSPIFHIHHAKSLPIDFYHGVLDGQTGSVPFRHSIDAFNILARLHNAPQVSEDEIMQLWQNHKLTSPLPQDTQPDPDLQERVLLLRRTAGPSRLTVFHGGHEGLPHAGCQWLEKHVGPARG